MPEKSGSDLGRRRRPRVFYGSNGEPYIIGGEFIDLGDVLGDRPPVPEDEDEDDPPA